MKNRKKKQLVQKQLEKIEKEHIEMKKEIETLKKNWKNNAVISGLPVVGKSTEEVKEIVKKIHVKAIIHIVFF